MEDISDGYYFESIDYQVNLAAQTRFSRTVKVLTENAGAENAGQIYINFEPKYQTLILHELYLLRDGKRLDRLNMSKFELMPYETELSRSIYNGTYSAYLLLEDLRKDDKIVLSYSVKGFNPVFGEKFFDSYTLQGFEPTGLLHVNYIVPKGRKLNFKTFMGATAPTQHDHGLATAYYWDIAGTDKTEYEPNTPLWHTTKQRIECSEFEKWSDVGKWASDVNPIPALVKPGKLQQFAEDLWQKAKGDSMEYARQITDFVQNEIRYMGIEVGEYSHRANSPEKVFAQRYGDCKDKSVLLASMLKYKGIDSELALVNSLEEYNLDEYLPSPAAFNHMVVYFSVDGRGQFIDPTITDQGGALRDRYFPFYGKVLWAKPGATMYDTEKIVAGNTRVEERFHLQKDGAAILDVLTIYTGSDADNIRSYFKQNAKNQIEKSYLEYYQRLYKQTTKQSTLTYEDDMAGNIFQVKESYSIKKISELDLTTNRNAVSVYAPNLSSLLPDVMESRVAPIALSYPLAIEHDVYIINPEGVNIPTMRENSFTARESYYYGKTVTTSKDTIKIAFRLGFHDTYVKDVGIQEYITDFSDKNSIFSAAIFLDNDGFVTGSNTHNQLNWWSVFGFICLLVLFTWTTFRYYHARKASSLIPLYDEAEYNDIGGWLILLAIALFVSPIRIFFSVMIPLSFSEQVWASLSYNVGVSPFVYGMFLIAEFIANTMIMFLSAYCFYLLIKKRDIFPQTLFALLMLQVLAILLDIFVSLAIFNNKIAQHIESTEMVRGIFFAIIWSLYLFKSTRVKGTFVVPHTSKVEPQLAFVKTSTLTHPSTETQYKTDDDEDVKN
ncbi:hypothetical protein GCM10011418_22680 [Sphingobacterium alkalisoli]|nr:hypothetical protein GCM10011418_22680 [Sphingobacterium alkalisoli]